MKGTLFCPQFSPQNAENRIIAFYAFEISQFSGQVPNTPPPPPQKKGTNGPLLLQSVALFKPTGYFNFY